MNGIAAERKVARDLTEKGFLVSSRRHAPGAGDILAVQRQSVPLTWDPLLVEVKATDAGPYAGFPPEDRTLMRETGFHFNLEPVLAWVCGERIFYIAESDWPNDPPAERKTNRPRTDRA
jgi:hypothetical protein